MECFGDPTCRRGKLIMERVKNMLYCQFKHQQDCLVSLKLCGVELFIDITLQAQMEYSQLMTYYGWKAANGPRTVVCPCLPYKLLSIGKHRNSNRSIKKSDVVDEMISSQLLQTARLCKTRLRPLCHKVWSSGMRESRDRCGRTTAGSNQQEGGQKRGALGGRRGCTATALTAINHAALVLPRLSGCYCLH